MIVPNIALSHWAVGLHSWKFGG